MSDDILLKQREAGSLLLLGHAHGATTSAGGLGVLTAHTQTERRRGGELASPERRHSAKDMKVSGFSPPEVPEAAVGPDLLQPLQVFSQLVVQTVGEDLQETAVSRVRAELNQLERSKAKGSRCC